MCGIIGIIGNNEVTPFLMEGLKRLEYRGYDSSGIATINDGQIELCRSEGKIVNLENRINGKPNFGKIGIGHTRWATHGVASENNAHPHSNGRVAVVHNGIIENFHDLKATLVSNGVVFKSDTDTEVVVHLVQKYLDDGHDPVEAAHLACKMLVGAFALAILIADADDILIGASNGSPLAVGFGEGEMFVGSDALALAPMTQKIAYLHDGDFLVLRRDGMVISDFEGTKVDRVVRETVASGALIGKNEYRHFMIKEINEQPKVIADTLGIFVSQVSREYAPPDMPFESKDLSKITIVGCGSAYLAGLVAKYWFEEVARLPTEVDIGSEFRYRSPPLPKNGLAVFVSQSGETIDTLFPLRYCKNEMQTILSIVNVVDSSIARESDALVQTLAGPEIGVASTKAFTSQLTVFACLALGFGIDRGIVAEPEKIKLIKALSEVPAQVSQILKKEDEIVKLAHSLVDARDVLYLGRGSSYPIALEGALKLKEISYIHAEGYASGEMKHGPIALIDDSMPVVVIAPSDDVFEKTLANIEQVVARGGRVIALTDKKGVERMAGLVDQFVEMPSNDPYVNPILYSIPVQLLAYHTAVLKGTDVDQPRNLAKSVTVE